MKIRFLLLALVLSLGLQARTIKTNIKGFGEVSITQQGDKQIVDLGKFGKFNCTGTINPLSLTVQTTVENLRQFPGYKVYNKMGLQDVTLHFAKDGVAFEATIDTKKTLGPVFQMLHIPNPTLGISVAVSKQSFSLGGELDFEENPLIINVIPDFSRFTLEKFEIGAAWERGQGELEASVGIQLQTRWKPTEWDPDIQSITTFTYNLTSNTISASISMTDTWSNPMLLSKILKPGSVVFSDVAASIDWPIGAPAPDGFGFNVGKAQFFGLEFAVQLSMTPADKQIALYASRNQFTMNDLAQILRNGFGLSVPNVFPENIYIKDAEILFSPTGGEVGEFEIPRGFMIRGNAKFMEAVEAKVDFNTDLENTFELHYKMDASFKTFFENELRNNPKLKFIVGKVLNTLEVKKMEVKMTANKGEAMKGGTDCHLRILKQDVKFHMEGQFSPTALKNKVIDEAMKIAGPEAAAVVGAVGKGAKAAGELAGAVVGGGTKIAKKYIELAKIKRHHLGHKVPYCRSHCVPARVNELGNPALQSSIGALDVFQNRIIDDLVQVEGETQQATRALRKELIQKEWNELNRKIEEDWKVVWQDGRYVGFFLLKPDAKAGGVLYRKLVDRKKAEYIRHKNQVFNNLLNARFVENPRYTTIVNRWKQTLINKDANDKLNAAKISPTAPGAQWIIEPVEGTQYVTLFNRKSNTYLQIVDPERKVEEITPDMPNAHWVLDPVERNEYYRIKSRIVDAYFNVEKGKLRASTIEPGWHSAQWKINYNDFKSKVWCNKTHHAWAPGQTLLVSENRKYSLVFQKDGNLVLYKYGVVPLWATNTVRRGSGVRFEKRGFLVVHNASKSTWVSGSHDKGGEALFLQNDGNLVIHAPGARMIWQSGTSESQMAAKYGLHIDYDRNSGCGRILQNGNFVKKHCGWSKNWHSITVVGVTGSGTPDRAMFYDKAAGIAELYRIDAQGNMSLLQRFTGFSKNWSNITWVNEHGGLLKFEQADGFWEKYRTDTNGNISLHSRK